MFLDVTGKPRKEKVEQEKPKKPAYDWCFENSINTGKQQLDIKEQEFKYEKWRTNSSLSNFIDTVFYANEMNMNSSITDQMHYDYLFYSIKKKKRYGIKKTQLDKQLEAQSKEQQEKISLIQEYYKYGYNKALAALGVLTDDQIEIIRKKLEKGGSK